MRNWTRIWVGLSLAALLVRPALAAATSEAYGKVEDAQGNPIPEASVTFVNAGDAKATYDVKTDKKGRYTISGLLYIAPGSSWKVSVKAPKFVQSKIKVESRTQEQTVANFEANMKPDGTPHSVPIRPLGKAKVDFVMVPAETMPDVAGPGGAGAEPGVGDGAAPRSAKDPLQRAAERIADGDYAGSVEFYNKAIDEKPDDPDRKLELAKVLYKLERYKEAETQALKAAELAPGKPGPNRVLANIYYKDDQYDKADAAINRERQIAPNDPAVLVLVAQLAEEMGHADEAIGAYQSLVGMNPQNVQAWLALGNLYAQKKQPDKSEEAYRKVTELDPSNAPQTFYNIGAVIMNKPSPTTADTRKAAEAFRKAVALKPDYGAAYKQLGYASLNLGELKEARAALEKYLELEPKSPDAAQLRDLLKGLPKNK